MPFDWAKTFGQCTLTAATTMTDTINAGPTGPQQAEGDEHAARNLG